MWISDDIDALFEIEGYKNISLDRNFYGGGNRICLLNTLYYTVLNAHTGIFFAPEALTIKLTMQYLKPYYINCIYRLSNKPIRLFLERLSKFFSTPVISKRNNCFVLGDLNINLTKTNNLA